MSIARTTINGFACAFLCLLLTACMGTIEQNLEKAEIEARGDTYEPAITGEQIPPIEAKPQIRASSAASLSRLGFTPVDGLPKAMEGRLSESLRRAAFRRNMFLVPNGDRTQTHIVKGYVSLTNNSLGTVIVYIWDVSANNGSAVQRISGQVLAPNGDGTWNSIDKQALDTLAVNSMESIIQWLNQKLASQSINQSTNTPFVPPVFQ
ncbi:MAG: hypothetical protein JKY99_11840 [Rhizobiales bacterium]|nr:hypothetical protein [Hyphomicrobiales bacterium]